MEGLQAITTNIKIRKHTFLNQEVTIQEFEQACNITIPAVYRRFLSTYDGGELDETMFEQGEFSFYIESFFGFSGGSESFHTLKEQTLFQTFIQKGYLAIAKDAFGDYVLLCIRGSQYGSVYFFAHDEPCRYQLITQSFLQFIQCCKSDVDIFQHGVYQDVILYRLDQDDIFDYDNMKANEIDRILEEENQPNKDQVIQRLMDRFEPSQEGYLHFDHFAFKLLVIQQLMYQHKYLPEYNLYDAIDKLGLDSDDLEDAGPYLFALRYFKALQIPVEFAQYVDELTIDSNLSIYANIGCDDASVKPWIPETLSDQELRQFTNLKSVFNRCENAIHFVGFLRMQGIEVVNQIQGEDDIATHIIEILQHPEQCLQTQYVNGETFLHLLRVEFGGYYQALFSEDLQRIVMNDQKIDQKERYQTMIQVLSEALRKHNLTLIRCVFPNETCHHYILTGDINKLRQCIVTWDDPTYHIEYDMKTMQWSILPMPDQANSDYDHTGQEQIISKFKTYNKKVPKYMKKPFYKRKVVIIGGIVLLLVVFDMVNYVWNHMDYYIYYEDFERGFQTVSKNSHDYYLEDLEGQRLLEEGFESIEPTYSSLVFLEGDDLYGIYDTQQQARIHGDFTYACIIQLRKSGKILDYEGILATKDERHWYVYSEEHKDGMEILMEKDYYVSFYNDIVDLDTKTIIRED